MEHRRHIAFLTEARADREETGGKFNATMRALKQEAACRTDWGAGSGVKESERVGFAVSHGVAGGDELPARVAHLDEVGSDPPG